MRYKMFALILALTVATWAQTSTQTAPTAPQQSTVTAEKAKCACCDKMAAADAKDASACARHMKGGMKDQDGKEMASCCAGKEAKASGGGAMACMKNDKDKAASCCKNACSKDSCSKGKMAACCGGKCGKAGEKCCSGMKTEKTAKTCCEDDLRSESEAVQTFAAGGR
jgi:hypothetical protein